MRREEARPPLRVLLVEDCYDDALLVTAELSDYYAPTVERVLGREAMRRALHDQEWDVVISDHNLPGFSAIEALLVLLESHRDIPFIIVSGAIGEDLAVEAMKAGAHDFIMKDSLSKLVPAVRHAVHAAEDRRRHREAQNEVRESRERLRQLASHLETVREEERSRLAREIHDELGGILTALKMDISWLKRRAEARDERLGAKLASMTELTDGAIKTMRRIITDLRPSILDDLGLIPAIEWQLTEFQKRTGIQGELVLGHDPDVTGANFGQAQSVATFRIFQESLTNIARHAQAQRVVVGAHLEDGALVLEVADDGRGIDETHLRKQGSYGVLGMRERARDLGGDLTITGAPGRGTAVQLRLPLFAAREAEVVDVLREDSFA